MEADPRIDALAKALSTMPGLDPNKGRTSVNAAVRRLWATELIAKWGVSIDPTQATVEAVTTAPPQLGNIGPHTVRPKVVRDADEIAAGTALIEQIGPEFLAANRPDLASQMAAAKTPAQRAALSEELRAKILADPNSLVTDFVHLLQDGR